jgi:hypothetical protein
MRPCAGCGSDALVYVIDFGPAPLPYQRCASALEALATPRVPLALVRCMRCTLVQQREPIVAPREAALADLALHDPSHAAELVRDVVQARRLGADALVMHIESGDGWLLGRYLAQGIAAIGVEPARDAADVAERERLVPTWREPFDAAFVERWNEHGQRPNVVHLDVALERTRDIAALLRGAEAVLAEGGAVIAEVPYLPALIDQTSFSAIVPTRTHYWSLTSMVLLAVEAGLAIVDAEVVPGEPTTLLRLTMSRAGGEPTHRRVDALLAHEATWGIDRDAVFARFAERAGRASRAIRRELLARRDAGRLLVGFGPPGAFATLLHQLRAPAALLSAVIAAPRTAGCRFVPGTEVPVLDGPAALREDAELGPQVGRIDVMLASPSLRSHAALAFAPWLARGLRLLLPRFGDGALDTTSARASTLVPLALDDVA